MCHKLTGEHAVWWPQSMGVVKEKTTEPKWCHLC